MSNDKIAEELRRQCEALRTRPIPLSTMIPLMQRAADALEGMDAAEAGRPIRIEVGKSYLVRNGATVSIHSRNAGGVFIGSFGPGNESVLYIEDGRYVGPGFVQRGELRAEPWDVVAADDATIRL